MLTAITVTVALGIIVIAIRNNCLIIIIMLITEIEIISLIIIKKVKC